jgi:hypothetical protein
LNQYAEYNAQINSSTEKLGNEGDRNSLIGAVKQKEL